MYQRIAVAVDDSDTSDRALSEAIRLAKDQQAVLRIVYAVDETAIFGDAMISDPAEIEKAWVAIGNKVLANAREAAQKEGINAETGLLRTQDVDYRLADAVVNDAKEWHADLLIAGTHGRTGLRHLILGSVAEGLLRITPIPILLIRAS